MCHLIRSGIKYTMKYQAIRQLFVYCYPPKYELIHLNNNLFWCATIQLSHSSWKSPRSGNSNFDLRLSRQRSEMKQTLILGDV